MQDNVGAFGCECQLSSTLWVEIIIYSTICTVEGFSNIPYVLSVTLLPFIVSSRFPECCHTNDLNVANVTLWFCYVLTSGDSFSPQREISSHFNNCMSHHTPTEDIHSLFICKCYFHLTSYFIDFNLFHSSHWHISYHLSFTSSGFTGSGGISSQFSLISYCVITFPPQLIYSWFSWTNRIPTLFNSSHLFHVNKPTEYTLTFTFI